MTVREMRDRLFNIQDQTAAVRRVLPAYAKYTISPNETVEQMRHRLYNLEPQDGPIEQAKDSLSLVPITDSKVSGVPVGEIARKLRVSRSEALAAVHSAAEIMGNEATPRQLQEWAEEFLSNMHDRTYDSARKAPARLHRALDAVSAVEVGQRVNVDRAGSGVVVGPAPRVNGIKDVYMVKLDDGRTMRVHKDRMAAKDSARKAPARLHRALDAILDARPVRAKDTVDVGEYKGWKIKQTGARVFEASKSGEVTQGDVTLDGVKRMIERYMSGSGPNTKAHQGKDRIPADCLDLGTLAL